jgi:uncharacterized protein DUF2752
MSSIAYIEGVQIEKHSRKLAALTLAGLSLVFLVSVVIRPAEAGPSGDYFTVCGFKTITGLPCPGCGLTHSFCALGKGDLPSAFAFNALGPLLFLALAMAWLRALLVLANKTQAVTVIDQTTTRYRLVRNCVIVFGIFGVGRILYLIFFAPPQGLGQSPLLKLIARLVG